MHILDSLVPVFLLIGLGAFLVRIGFLKQEMLKGMNDLAYWIGLPSFIFYRLATVSLRLDELGPMLAVFLGGTAAAVVGALVIVRLLRLPVGSRGTFIQASFRGNLAFIGLPVVIFALNGLGEGDLGRAQELAVLALAPIMILYNVGAVFVLYASHAGSGPKLIVKTFRQLITNPLILASVGGLAVAMTGGSFPLFLDRSLEALSRLALPLALLCIGGSLLVVPLKGSVGPALAASLVKVALAPIAGVGVGLTFGIEPGAMLVAVIYLACPTAAASYVLARQLGGDEALAASTVVLSTLLSMASLSVAVGLL
jgi:malate permease and related proteins